MRGCRPLLLPAMLAAASSVAACQAPITTSAIGISQAAIAADDFRADGVSRREVVVKLSPGARLPAGAKVKRTIRSLDLAILEVPAGKSPEQALSGIARTAGLRYAEVVRRVEFEEPAPEPRQPGANPGDPVIVPGQPGAAPTEPIIGPRLPAPVPDPRQGEQFGLGLVKAPEAWQTTRGDRNTLLAIVDSGIDLTHPELRGQVSAAFNVLTRTADVRDAKGHGTHTSGIAVAAAGNGEGGSGVAPGCGLLAVQISAQGQSGISVDPSRSSDVLAAEGIAWAVDNGAKVVSMSFGFYRRSRPLEDALQYALDRDVVLVASAGNNHARNDHETAPHLPSTYPGVLEVAAVDRDARVAKFSNYGKTVAVAAPGVDVLSSIPGGYAPKSGTSMAAPHVAGVAALIRSQFPGLDRAAVRQRIESSARDLGNPGYDDVFGNGLVDAAAALRI
ncbi:MAG: S8 family serine peptidase [Candidatus Sericytochromatia bacterium]|nr:S8 family serine peptidase [Candidatus Tanganyikabacteria bacterium]